MKQSSFDPANAWGNRTDDQTFEERTMQTQNEQAEAVPVDPIVSDETYYQERFELLIAWLETNEKMYDALAQTALDKEQMGSATKHMAASSMAKRARMWIRNHVSFSR